MFRHLIRFCRSYIRSVIMFHMAKHSSIQSIVCDFRHATTSSLCIHSRISLFMQRLVSCLPKITPQFINHEMCHKTVNPNSLEINPDHFPSISSPNFRLSGGSLGYWTACNNLSATVRSPTVALTPKSKHSVSTIRRVNIHIKAWWPSIYSVRNEARFLFHYLKLS